MPLDDQVTADLRRQARDLVQRQDAHERVPQRIQALRRNIARIEGRGGHAAEMREQNEFELRELVKRAEVEGIQTEVPDEEESE